MLYLEIGFSPHKLDRSLMLTKIHLQGRVRVELDLRAICERDLFLATFRGLNQLNVRRFQIFAGKRTQQREQPERNYDAPPNSRCALTCARCRLHWCAKRRDTLRALPSQIHSQKSDSVRKRLRNPSF